MFAYCGNNPVNCVDFDGYCWKKIANAIEKIINAVKSYIEEQKSSAREKYNEDTVNINGSNPEGTIDVSVDGSNVKITNSYEISNRYEKEAILNVIIDSPDYEGTNDVEKMKVEWSAHNFAYNVTYNEKINEWISAKLGKDDAHASSKDVDFAESDSLSTWYYLVTLGGIISW